MKNIGYNVQHDSYLRTSYQNEDLNKQRNCNIRLPLRKKQPSINILRKRFSENIQRIYRRTPMP